MKALMFAIVAVILITGCSDVKTETVEVEVIKVIEEDTKWGCIGTQHKTLVQVENGHREYVCDKLGQSGDKFKMCIVSGHWDSINNGLRRNCY